MMAEVREAMAAYDALDPKAPAKAKQAALRNLRSRIDNAEPNVTFAAKSLTEHAENVVEKARADVEAMVTQKAAQLGLTTGQTAGVLELPLMPGEDRPELESPR
jgi:hypothetical protein